MQDRSQKPPADPGVRRQRRPAFTVRAAIERDQQILFMRARDESSSRPDGCWYFLPGGHVNHRETLEQALRREIREEIGIELDHLRPAFLREFIAPLHQRLSPEMPPDHHVIALIYRCRPVPGATPRFKRGVDGTRVVDDLLWIDRDQLELLDIRPPHLRQGLSTPESDSQPLTLWPEQ